MLLSQLLFVAAVSRQESPTCADAKFPAFEPLLARAFLRP